MLRGWSKADWVVFWIKVACNPVAWAAVILAKVFVVSYLDAMALPEWGDFKEAVWEDWARFGRLWMKAGFFLWMDE